MLNRALARIFLVPLIAAGCPDSTASGDGDVASGSTTSGEPATDAGSGARTASTGSTTAGSSSSEGSVDLCPPGVGVDWPRVGAYLTLQRPEDFTVFGAQELDCSVERSLDADELDSLSLLGASAAVELRCEVPGHEDASPVALAVRLPEATPSLEALVGLQGVTLSFHYSGPSRGEMDTGADTTLFGLRDEKGVLLISQALNCEGPFVAPGLECGFFMPPFMVPSSWSDPLPEPTLAPGGCGTRPWEYDQAPSPGVYEMTRLAIRFDTDAGVVDALDQEITSLELGGATYEFFAVEAVGEDDPSVLFDTSSYNGSIRFLIIREP